MDKILYTIEEASHIIGMSRSTIFRLIKAKKIRTLKEGRIRRIPATSIARYIEKQILDTYES